MVSSSRNAEYGEYGDCGPLLTWQQRNEYGEFNGNAEYGEYGNCGPLLTWQQRDEYGEFIENAEYGEYGDCDPLLTRQQRGEYGKFSENAKYFMWKADKVRSECHLMMRTSIHGADESQDILYKGLSSFLGQPVAATAFNLPKVSAASLWN
eukprot:scaffold59841_cov17-Tisochrysis_lutea.AAC.1